MPPSCLVWLEIFVGTTIRELPGRFAVFPMALGSIEGVVVQKKIDYFFSNLLWNTIVFEMYLFNNHGVLLCMNPFIFHI